MTRGDGKTSLIVYKILLLSYIKLAMNLISHRLSPFLNKFALCELSDSFKFTLYNEEILKSYIQ